jgi:Na+/proline symporter
MSGVVTEQPNKSRNRRHLAIVLIMEVLSLPLVFLGGALIQSSIVMALLFTGVVLLSLVLGLVWGLRTARAEARGTEEKPHR